MAKRHNYRITYDVQVDTNEYLSQCNSKDIISVNSEKWISIEKLRDVVKRAFNFSNGLNSIISYISSASGFENNKIWFQEGEECEILRTGSKGWQKGKIKINITLEFIPDEVEEDKSPLDDIRQADKSLNNEQ